MSGIEDYGIRERRIIPCHGCGGRGWVETKKGAEICPICGGKGYIIKPQRKVWWAEAKESYKKFGDDKIIKVLDVRSSQNDGSVIVKARCITEEGIEYTRTAPLKTLMKEFHPIDVIRALRSYTG